MHAAAAQRASRQPTMTEFLRRSHSATRGAPRAAAEPGGGGSGGCQLPLASGSAGESPVSLSSLASFFGRASEVVSPSSTPRSPRVDDNGGGLPPPGCARAAKRQRLTCGSSPEQRDDSGEAASAAVAGSCAVPAAARAINASGEPSRAGCRGRRKHSPSAAAVARGKAEASSDDDDDGDSFGDLPSGSSPGDHAATPLRTYGHRRPSACAPARQPDAVGQSRCDGDAVAVKVDVNKENVPSNNSAGDACGGDDGKLVQEGGGGRCDFEPCGSGPVMVDSRARPSAGSTKSPPAAASRNLIQMKLDLGQKEVAGDPRLCPRCGMMYTPGDESDELLHRRFHGKAEEALKFPGWKNEDVVLENPDGSRVICIQPSARGHALAKLKAVQAIMDEELGAHDSNSLLQNGRKAYLYISGRSSQQHQQQIKGVCVAEPIACGYRLLGGSGSEAMASDEQEPACCGIYRLWVCRTGRRQGVATCLLNAVRMHCVPGRYVSEDKLAFSDPTELGKLFAASYTRNDQFLIYK